jgi:hypothetical protein
MLPDVRKKVVSFKLSQNSSASSGKTAERRARLCAEFQFDITKKSTKKNELMLLEKLIGVVNYNLINRIINVCKKMQYFVYHSIWLPFRFDRLRKSRSKQE